MHRNFILQLPYADMLIHARLADRHNTHSSAKAVLFRETPPVQFNTIQFWPRSITKACPSAEELLIQKAGGNWYSGQSVSPHGGRLS